MKNINNILIKFISITFLSLIAIVGCDSQTEDYSSKSSSKSIFSSNQIRDLKTIKEDGKLRALVAYSSTSYFLYRGRTLGYEYELLKRLAKHLDLKLEIVVAKNINDLLDELEDGNVDLVAHGLSITKDRSKKVQFTNYLYLTNQVLVQKKPDNWRKIGWANLQKSIIHDPIALIDDTVSVRKNTSYYKRLLNLSDEIGGEIHINKIKGNKSTSKIIEMVANGEIKYTVADDNLAKINASYYPILNVDVPISFSQRVAWAVNSESPELLKAINNWISKERKEADFYVIYNKYFKNKKNFSKRIKSEFLSINNNQISKYDELIKKYANSIQWDWRLVASQIYQESQFKSNASSWAGARGLMQLMPPTAKELGVKNISDPEDNIKGGTKYLKKIYNDFEKVNDSIQKIKFTLASFNCGYYHVQDARRLAKERDLNPNIWDDNVEKMILELSHPENYQNEVVKYGYVRGIEPYTYVNQIMERYTHYKNFISL